jgi:LysR family cys regulon transcriptional activator
MAYDAKKDDGLLLLDGSALFPPNVTRIGVHRGHYLRGFAYRFIELCASALTEARVREALAPRKDEMALD